MNEAVLEVVERISDAARLSMTCVARDPRELGYKMEVRL